MKAFFIRQGIERLVLLLQQQSREQRRRIELDIFVAGLGAAASDLCYGLVHELRKNGFRVGMDHEGRSLKSQMIGDVIAFPKTQKATCPLTEAPAGVSRKQLTELYLRPDWKE